LSVIFWRLGGCRRFFSLEHLWAFDDFFVSMMSTILTFTASNIEVISFLSLKDSIYFLYFSCFDTKIVLYVDKNELSFKVDIELCCRTLRSSMSKKVDLKTSLNKKPYFKLTIGITGLSEIEIHELKKVFWKLCIEISVEPIVMWK